MRKTKKERGVVPYWSGNDNAPNIALAFARLVLLLACLASGLSFPSLADNCYLTGAFAGTGPGNDLLTRVDLTDSNPATNELNVGTTTGVSNTQAIAKNLLSGQLMAVAGGTLGVLDTATGLYDATGFVPVGSGNGIHQGSPAMLTFNLIYGLTYDPTAGVFYAASRQSGPDVLIQIDPATGARVAGVFAGNDFVDVTPVNGLSNVNGLAIDPLDGVLYAVAMNAVNAAADLVRIDKTTGAATFVGDVNVRTLLRLSFTDDGQLWGYANDSDFMGSSTQRIFEIDKTGITNPVDSNAIEIDNDIYYTGIACRETFDPVRSIVKRAFQVDGTPIADGSTLPRGMPVKFLLYIDNPAAVVTDASLQDVLAPLFSYQAGSLKMDNTLVSSVVCPGGACDELVIFAQVDGSGIPLGDGDAVTPMIDADVGSYDPATRTIDLGDSNNVNNARLDLADDRVWALTFTVKIQ